MKYALVVIGASLGGLKALRAVLSALPRGFRLPLAIAQHRRTDAGDALQVVLQESCLLPVQEVEDKSPIEPGRIYLAPGGYHLLVEGEHFALCTDGSEAVSLPSVDVLFETAAESFGARLIGVVLSGTGCDGAAGLAAVERSGGCPIVQDVEAYAPGMPEAAAEATPIAVRLPLERIGPYLVRLAAE